MLSEFLDTARSIYGEGFVPLHRPLFLGKEREYLVECIDSNFVSSVGQKVTDFEVNFAEYVGSKYAVAVVNGTAALQIALKLVGVEQNTEVLTQDLTFVATANAISHLGSEAVFIDVSNETLGLCPISLRQFLQQNAQLIRNECWNRKTGRKISACVPMHTFGNPCQILEILEICKNWNIPVVEDAAEALGSKYNSQHLGTFGKISAFSFNGNKIITTGGGGMLVTNDEKLAWKAKHITTTAKVPHAYEFVHDEIGYNYRMPNLNAALGCAQLELLPSHLAAKKEVSKMWQTFFTKHGYKYITSIANTDSNNWLNAVQFETKKQRNEFLDFTNANGIMTRPVWELMSRLEIYKHCQKTNCKNAKLLADTVVNIPSSVPEGWLEKPRKR